MRKCCFFDILFLYCFLEKRHVYILTGFQMVTKSQNRLTELFCIIDEFCKHFDAENAGNLLEDKRRRRAASLSDSEIMTILLYFHFGTFRNFKHYYLFFTKGTMKSYFPKTLPSTPYLMSFSSKRKLYNRIGQN